MNPSSQEPRYDLDSKDGSTPSPFPHRSDLLAVLALLIFILICQGRLILDNRFGVDTATFDHDFEVVVPAGTAINAENLRRGMPLWNQYWMSGGPSLGFLVTALCHPGKILTLLFDFPTYFKVHYLLYALIGALGYYVLMRKLRIGPIVAMIAAGWAVSAGFNYWQSLFETSWRTIALYPWLNLVLIRLVKRPRTADFVWLQALIYLGVTAGDAEMFSVGYLGSALFFLIYCVTSGLGLSRTISRLVLLGLATGGGVILTSVQILPFLEMVGASVRGQGFSYQFFLRTFDPWWDAFGAVGIMAARITPVHFGVVAFCAAAWAVRHSRRDPLVLAVVLVLIISTLAMLGGGTPLPWIMFHLPVLGKLIRHYKWIIVINFHLILLLGWGLEDLLKAPPTRRIAIWIAIGFVVDALLPPFPIWVKGPALAAGLCAVAAWIKPNRLRWAPALVALQSLIVISPMTLHDGGTISDYSPSRAYQQFTARHQDRFRSQVMYPPYYRGRQKYPVGKLPLQLGFPGQSSTLDSWWSYPERSYRSFLLLLHPEIIRVAGYPDEEFMMKASFKSFDFITPENRHLVNLLGLKYFFTYDFALRQADVYPLLHSPAWKDQPLHLGLITEERPDAVTLAPGDSLHFEFEADPADELRLRIEPPQSTAPRVLMARGDSILELKGASRGEDLVYPLSLVQNSPVTLTLSSASGTTGPVKVLEPAIHNPRHTIVKLPVEGLDVYENTEVLPRAFLVEEVEEVPDDEAAGRFMSDPAAFDPARTAVIKSPAPRLETSAPGRSKGRVEWKAYPPDRVDLAVDSERGGMLILTDNYYPGWKAFVDGMETRLHRVDLTFRGVQVPPGSHEVSFSYQPASFAVGLWQSLGAAAALIFAIVAAVLVRRSRRPARVATEP